MSKVVTEWKITKEYESQSAAVLDMTNAIETAVVKGKQFGTLLRAMLGVPEFQPTPCTTDNTETEDETFKVETFVKPSDENFVTLRMPRSAFESIVNISKDWTEKSIDDREDAIAADVTGSVSTWDKYVIE